MLIHLLIATLALLGTAYFIPGFKVNGFWSAMITAIIIGIMNILVRPLLLFLTLPLNILTLGLFTFVVNAIVLKLCAAFAPGFEIKNWRSAILGAIVLVIITNVAYWLLTPPFALY
jgi:putative membrane protein